MDLLICIIFFITIYSVKGWFFFVLVPAVRLIDLCLFRHYNGLCTVQFIYCAKFNFDYIFYMGDFKSGNKL